MKAPWHNLSEEGTEFTTKLLHTIRFIQNISTLWLKENIQTWPPFFREAGYVFLIRLTQICKARGSCL